MYSVYANTIVYNCIYARAHQVLVATLFCVILTYAKIADNGSVVQVRKRGGKERGEGEEESKGG